MDVRQAGRVFRAGRGGAMTRRAMLLEEFLSGGDVGGLRLRRNVLLRTAGQCEDQKKFSHRVNGISYDTPKRIRKRLLFEVTPNEGLIFNVRPAGIAQEMHGAR